MCAPALFPILMDRLLVLSNSLENISIFPLLAGWEFLQATTGEWMYLNSAGSMSCGMLSNGVCENISTSSFQCCWLASLCERTSLPDSLY